MVQFGFINVCHRWTHTISVVFTCGFLSILVFLSLGSLTLAHGDWDDDEEDKFDQLQTEVTKLGQLAQTQQETIVALTNEVRLMQKHHQRRCDDYRSREVGSFAE